MENRAKTLFWEIINCSNICEHFSGQKNICSKIIDFQKQEQKEDLQVPEPWSGNILTAKVLIVGSNPGFTAKERFPKYAGNWEKTKIEDFFMKRFDENAGWTKQTGENQVRLWSEEKNYWKYQRYWSGSKKFINSLLNGNCNLNEDVCFTELVHCKSNKEYGVKAGVKDVCKKYLTEILNLCPAKIIIVSGGAVRKDLQDLFNIENLDTKHPAHIWRDKLVLFITHFSAHNGGWPKSFNDFSCEDQKRIKSFLLE